MNLHAPQSVEAATELREIAAVSKQLISPRLSKPLISVVQDTLVGVNRLTRPTEFFTRREYMNLLVHSKRWDGRIPPPAKADPLPLWSGQQVVSALLPAIYLEMGNKMWDEAKGKTDPNYVIIQNGVIQQGILDGDVFDKALIHVLYNDFGPEMTIDFLDSLQAVVAAYLQNSGFSVGLSDLVADADTLAVIGTDLADLKKQIESLQLQLHTGLFDNTTGRTNQEAFEMKVFETLNKAISSAGKTGLKSLIAANRMVNMVRCGSKGSDLNIAQMIALLGQQSIEGKRIAYGFQDRTLPHFKRYDDGAEARGFIESSFVKGLSPAEFFFHAMTGREGLIDTAVKTADSGYMQRQLVKTMEDLTTFHDGSVRDAGGLIVQFAYGDDGTSATKIENQPIGLAKMTDTEIRDKFAVSDVAADKSQAYIAALFRDRDMLVQNVWSGRVEGTVQSAVHLRRLIGDAIQQLALTPGQGVPVSGAHVLETIERIQIRTRRDNELWGALLRFHLNPRELQARGFTRAAFDWLAEQIVIRHMKSWVAPGEMAGIISAQSLGEPTTQMSAPFSTVITIGNLQNPENSFMGPIGAFIDARMKEAAETVVDLGHGSTVLDLPADTWAIMGVSNQETTSWRPISQVSRHPANGGLVKVTTRSGRTTTATLSHSFLRRTTNGIAEIKGADLQVGHRIPVAYRMPASPTALSSYNGFALTREFGWLFGIYLADGSFNGKVVCITKTHPVVEERIRALATTYSWPVSARHYAGEYGPSKTTSIHSAELKQALLELGNTGSFEKRINAPVFHANADFIAGVLSGYFDGDGNVNASRQQIRAGSRSEGLIRDIARLLATQGVFATIKEETSVRMPGQTMYVANVIRKHAAQFQDRIGFALPEKAAALAEIVAYNARTNAHSQREDLDLIPELGDVIAETGQLLSMPGQSRTYGRYSSARPNPKQAVGRCTLETYIAEFKEAVTTTTLEATTAERVTANLATLTSAANGDVLWDEITALEILPDPHQLVYDFTVPGNDSFMVDDNIFVHNTLNTFHLSGVAAKSGMTRGVPRLKELLKVTQNPRATSLTIYLRPDIRQSKEEARRLAQELEFTMLKDVVVKSRIYYDPRDSASLVAEDQEWLSFFSLFEQETEPATMVDEEEGAAAAAPTHSPWIVRLEMDREKMFAKNITMEDVAYVLRHAAGDSVKTTYTDHNATRMVFRVRLARAADKGALDDLAAVKATQTKLLTQTLVRGLPGLRAVSFRKVPDELYERNMDHDGKYEPVEQFVIDTFGTNFLDVLIHPDVDGRRLISNHVHDIYENLGVEAARQILFKEIFGLFADAAPVNYRHVALLVDAMSSRGRLMSADRFGTQNKKMIGPLAKASFEQAGDIMLRAALFGEMDPVTSVSSNIMTGQPIRGGTSFTQVLLDEAALAELVATAPPPRRAIERAPQLVQEQIDAILEAPEKAGCRQEDLRIPAALPPMDPGVAIAAQLPELDIILVDE